MQRLLHVFKGKRNAFDYLAIALIVIAIAAGVYFYPLLPTNVASHWNADGLPNGETPKDLFVAGYILFMAIAYVAFSLLPKVKQFKPEYELIHREYSTFKTAIIAFLTYIFIGVLLINANYFDPLAIHQLLMPGLSLLFYYIGIASPRLKRNALVGIRTPWTMQSDYVWHETHRSMGKLFKAGAVILMLGLFLPARPAAYLTLAVALLTGLGAVLHSYLTSQKEQQKRSSKKAKTGKRQKKTKSKKRR